MKTCIECGEEFKPIGRQKVCKECKGGVQKKVSEPQEETGTKRPLDRFGRMVFGGGGVMFRR